MALTNDDILKLVNFTIRKDTKGQPLTRENFSLLLESQGLEYYEELYDQYEKTQEITDSIKRFKVTKYGAQLSFTGNTIDIPTDYAHSGSLYHKKSGTDVKPIDILDDDKFIMRQSEFIDAPSVDYPIARFTTDYIEYEPSTLDQSYFGLSYLKYPTAAVYDYYINVNGLPVYLAEGATHIWTTGEIDSTGVEHTTGDPNWSSLTKELDFNEEDKLKITWRILQAVGVPIDEVGVYQYAEQLKLES